MKNKISIFRVLLTVIVLGGVAAVIIARQYGPVAPPKQTDITTPAQIEQKDAEKPDTSPPANCVDRTTTKDRTDGYSVDIDFCVTGMEQADSRIWNEVASVNEQFLVDYAEFRTPETEGQFAQEISSEEFSFEADPQIQSVLLTIYTNTGGAHPNISYRTWTFDRSTDRIIEFHDMFQEEHNPLWTIYPTAKEQLMGFEYADEAMIDNGTGDENFENYRNFIIDGNELVIMFEPETVGAYAAGPQEVRIPLDDIQVILKPPFLNLEELYGEDLPPDVGVMTYDEVVESCEDAGGTWLEDHDECEYVSRDWCEDMGATFNECESACRHDPNAEICTLQCVPVCEL
ncbi:MAG: DUF3298 domain-containing protein [Patescibacteria group bacterium]|nr:DUF3298 domain-containing protein [Patescibacteria group bacterium]